MAMTKSLFVRNLSWSVTEDTLYEVFSQAGVVLTVKIPVRREDGKPRGFAFIEMETEEDAARAIEQLNGLPLDRRELVVTFQEEQPRSGTRNGGNGGEGYAVSRQPKSTKLFVRNLDISVNEAELKRVFEQVGVVLSVKIPVDRETGLLKGFGFVEMFTVEEAQQAIEQLNHTSVSGKAIAIDFQNPDRERRPPAQNSYRQSARSSYNQGYHRPY